ncbi:MAG: peptidylprolyl isomerase [Sphingomonadales bacterium]|nr:peptidylprolyl isomerase [Sphingomonadales bacterium]
MRSMKFATIGPTLGKLTLGKLLLGAAGLSLAVSSVAQTAPDDGGVVRQSLDIPADVTLFDNAQSNVYRPTARVNGEVITQTDVDQRAALLKIANNLTKLSPEEEKQLKTQVFSQLVDEKLQLQEARANDVTVSDEEVLQRFGQVARQFGMQPDEFSAYLTANGSAAVSLASQLRADLAWSRLLGRNVEPFTNVSAEEVKAFIERQKLAKGTAEYRIAEIYLSATPETAEATAQNALRLIDQIKQGASFTDLALQFSEASTAPVGGDLGFVRLDQLPSELATAAADMQPGQLAGPIEVPGGFSIIYLVDVKRILTADIRDAKLSLKQVTLPFPAGVTGEQASQLARNFAVSSQAIQGCGTVEEFASRSGASVVSRDDIAMRDLPGALQETMASLPIGQASKPFGSQEQGISVLVLCGRDLPDEVAAPDPDRLEQQLLQEKVEKRAKRYMRDLRLDALIQYS